MASQWIIFEKYFSLLLVCFTISFVGTLRAQEIAVLKYGGSGDWYANPTSLPNLIAFCNKNIGTQIEKEPQTVEPGDNAIYNYPFLHMTGHGNVLFTETEVINLRTYLLAGGFLHIDDNYGMEPYIKREIKKLFPNKELEEIPANHPIFSKEFDFPEGLPKIHEHDGKPPVALGIFEEDQLLLLYTLESDLGDGWEDEEVHNDPITIREKALKMGANIISYVFKS